MIKLVYKDFIKTEILLFDFQNDSKGCRKTSKGHRSRQETARCHE